MVEMVERYKPVKLSEIDPETDSKICLIGKVKEVKESSFILSDGTAEIELEDKGVEEGDLVRVFCSVDEGKLKVDILQNLKGFDLNLFNDIEKLYKRLK